MQNGPRGDDLLPRKHTANERHKMTALLDEVRAVAAQMERECAETRSAVDSWASTQKENINAVEKAHVTVMKECADAVPALEAEKRAVEARSSTVSQQLKEQDKEHAMVLAEVNTVKARADALPAEVQALKQIEAEQAHELQTAKRELAEAEQKQALDSKELTKGVVFYKKLGLEFVRMGEDRLKLTFTQVDAAQPQRAFSFAVHVNEHDVYQVDSCDPPVEGVDEMLRELNTNNDFSLFVRRMRAKFKAIA